MTNFCRVLARDAVGLVNRRRALGVSTVASLRMEALGLVATRSILGAHNRRARVRIAALALGWRALSARHPLACARADIAAANFVWLAAFVRHLLTIRRTVAAIALFARLAYLIAAKCGRSLCKTAKQLEAFVCVLCVSRQNRTLKAISLFARHYRRELRIDRRLREHRVQNGAHICNRTRRKTCIVWLIARRC